MFHHPIILQGLARERIRDLGEAAASGRGLSTDGSRSRIAHLFATLPRFASAGPRGIFGTPVRVPEGC